MLIAMIQSKHMERDKMKLDRASRKLLNLIISENPTMQGSGYEYVVIGNKSKLGQVVYDESLKLLSEQGAIEFFQGKMNLYFLTAKGRHYRQFAWLEVRDFLLKSVLVPIFVSFVTTILILWLG